MAGGDLEVVGQRLRLARWVAREVLPHEAHVRRWLRRSRVSAEDADEVIQEAYCRLATLETTDHITAPDAYFFSIVRNLLLRRLKRQRIVSFETIADIESRQDDRPSQEREVAGRMDYDKVLELMRRLPERCQQIVRLRKIEGWSQRRIAEHLGTTEKAVEKQVWLGIRNVRDAWQKVQQDSDPERDIPGRAKGRRQ